MSKKYPGLLENSQRSVPLAIQIVLEPDLPLVEKTSGKILSHLPEIIVVLKKSKSGPPAFHAVKTEVVHFLSLLFSLDLDPFDFWSALLVQLDLFDAMVYFKLLVLKVARVEFCG